MEGLPMVRTIFSVLVLTLCALTTHNALAEAPNRTVAASTDVLQDLLNSPMQGIPAALLSEAHAVAIVPNTIKVGLVIGGQRGKGVLVIREKDGSWRAPTFITITGGSVGFQIGAQGSDVVLVFKTQKSIDGLLKGAFKIGADASAAAGPVGRSVEAATDAQLKAEIYSYSRSRGLFAGLSVDGSVIQIDNQETANYYAGTAQGQPIPAAAQKLVELVAQVAAHPGVPVGQPVAVGAMPVAANAVPQMVPESYKLQQQLTQSAAQLYGRLDPAWRQFLALPMSAGVKTSPSVDELKNAQARFDAVAADPQYAALLQVQEFQTTRNLLQALIAARSAEQPTLNLPPPPQ
jgi:lipid-binding SYLF domain-containing protein